MAVDLSVPQFIIGQLNLARQRRMEQQKQSSDIAEQSERTKLLQQQHDQQGKQFEDMLKHLQLQNETQQAGIDAQRMQTELGFRNAFRTGAIKPTGQTQIPLGQAISDARQASSFQTAPSFTNSRGEQFQLPGAVGPQEQLAADVNRTQQIGSAEANVAGAKAGAVAGAEQPFQLQILNAKHMNDLQGMREKSSLDATNEMKKLIQEGHNSEQVAHIHGRYALEGDRIQAAAHIQGIRIGNEMRLDPDALNAAFNSVQSGQQDINKLPDWQQKTAVQAMYGRMGWVPPNEKHIEAATAAKGVQSLVGQYLELAKKYSRDSPGSTLDSATNMATAGFGGSELGSKLDALKSQGGMLATFFDKQNRKSDSEILRQGKGLFSPYATIQQNMDRIRSHESTFNESIKAGFSGMPDAQVNDILKRSGVTIFGGYGSSDKAPPVTDKSNAEVDLTTPVAEGKIRMIQVDAQGNMVPYNEQNAKKYGFKWVK